MDLNVNYIRSYLVSDLCKAEKRNGLVLRHLTVVAYNHAIVYPGIAGEGGGVVDGNDRFIEGTSLYAGVDQAGSYESTEIVESEDEVVYLGMFHGCWGHCITDFLQHLWFLRSPQVDDGLKHLKFCYTISLSWGRNLPKNFFEALRLLGFETDAFVRVERPTRFRRIHVPDSCFWHNLQKGYFEWTPEYVELVDLIVKKACPNPPAVPMRSVYLTRAGWGRGREFGEALIEREFRKKGFEIVRPETLSLVEMIQLLQSVKTFASTDGSCGHNAIFLQKGVESVIIRKADYINKYQVAIDHLRDLKATYVDANGSWLFYTKKIPVNGPFFLYVNKQAARFFGCSSHFPLWVYSCYLWSFVKTRLMMKARQIWRRVR